MKKDVQGQWNDQCETGFGEVKKILANPSVMGRSNLGHDLHLFMAVIDTTISATLV